ncbi:GNAT family N-acetyltransferase [Marinobacterium sedimentorum]|uniref:GNAT family N-acetyltransferase n=1 Tax=Marinobacterium sedimentorum TaxID=2927804 RepID=UPI0020C5FFA6|nr:GNAT family N-acetyltransferase [Marinobacterium sedimentorum]MCP8686083.1 GNAT family N-acetyltransferase [Marinobacterium sedimentorum]
MTTTNILTKTSFSLEVTQDIGFPALRALLQDVAPLYPCFDAWLNFTFRRNMRMGERSVVIAHDGNQLMGAALLKLRREESKICTFFVKPAYRDMNIGTELMDAALATLDRNDTFITVSDDRKCELTPLLMSKGFSVSHSIDGLYRPSSTEYFFTL